MSVILSHAKSEFAILMEAAAGQDERPLIEPYIDEIMAVVAKFSQGGDSGGSSPAVISCITGALESLLKAKPICPLTGFDQEWYNVSDSDVPMYQSKRCGAVFKHSDGTPYYLDALIFKAPDGQQFTTNSPTVLDHKDNPVRSAQTIHFPFWPKHFYIDVIPYKLKDEKRWRIKNQKQLQQALAFFSKPNA